jgi:rSAM/selenodomain-associated transferase 2
VAVVVPVLNEGSQLRQQLEELRARGADEIITVDGGSRDDSLDIARDFAAVPRDTPRCLALEAPTGRARQMNAGAKAARAKIIVFVHADTRLPPQALEQVRRACTRERPWGRFDVRLNGGHYLYRIVERAMNLRSTLTGIATGDQAIFVRSDTFAAVGGYPDIPLMEDIAISKRLKAVAPPVRIDDPVTTSVRRWETHGIVRTIVQMWLLRLRYWLGADPRRLARCYDQVREK